VLCGAQFGGLPELVAINGGILRSRRLPGASLL